jgi:hypothetical protein
MPMSEMAFGETFLAASQRLACLKIFQLRVGIGRRSGAATVDMRFRPIMFCVRCMPASGAVFICWQITPDRMKGMN